ncbi:hypothetical protein VHEMI04270 [[Torrubiella] hemipterigena]|uniref:Uncharacterized protein n=1 Tax=[Torrubiella] hemipterigena TaxID=1531966 RepID=A0A0A1TDT1_9HYPO|nr:hypothetical protein VHEMI04270 [[Torrubiella] hemipterigena]
MTNFFFDYVIPVLVVALVLACIRAPWKRCDESDAKDDARLDFRVKYVEKLARAETILAMAGESMTADERAQLAEAKAVVEYLTPWAKVWWEGEEEEFWAARRRKSWWRRW